MQATGTSDLLRTSGRRVALGGRRLLVLACLFVAVLLLAVWLSWLTMPAEQQPKLDFSAFWTASSLVLKGQASAAYDADAFLREQQVLPGDDSGYFPWLYPPVAFLLVWPLALLPHFTALTLWGLSTVALALSAIRRATFDPVLGLLLAVTFPATFLNLISGQNGLLTAGLAGWGLLLLDRRPALAGGTLGLLVFKPQLLPLVFLALLAGRHHRAAAALAITALVLVAASVGLFGLESWTAFLETSGDLTDSFRAGELETSRMQSIAAGILVLGSAELALVVQLMASIVCAVLVWLLWLSSAAVNVKAAGLVLAVLLATPYSYVYDLTWLGLAVLFLVLPRDPSHRLRLHPGLLVLVWMTPIIAVAMGLTGGVSPAPLVMMGLLAVVGRKALFRTTPAVPVRAGDLTLHV